MSPQGRALHVSGCPLYCISHHAGVIKFGGHSPSGNEIFISPRRSGFAYFVCCISHFVLPSPLVGRNNIGRRSSVHAVRARPLLTVKNNIEPDEQREEADTIPRGVLTPSHAPLRAHALRYAHLSASSSTLTRRRLGLGGIFFPRAGAHAPAYWLPPHAGLINSAGRARHEERLPALMVRPMRGEVRLRHAPQ